MSVANQNLSDQELDEIMDRIQKMMRLRDNSAATAGEVANASAMIQKLLLQYNISMEEIGQHEPAKKVEYVKGDPFDLGASSLYRAEWRVRLCEVVARNNFCRMRYVARSGNRSYGNVKNARAILIGKPYNIAVVKELYEWIAEQLNRLATKAWTEYHANGGYDPKPVFKSSFFRAAVSEIASRLEEEKRKTQVVDPNAYAMVVVMDQGLQTFYDNLYPIVKVDSSDLPDYHWFKKGPHGKSKFCVHILSKGPNTGNECGLEERTWMHYRYAKVRMERTSYSGAEAGVRAGREVNLQPKRKLERGSNREQLS